MKFLPLIGALLLSTAPVHADEFQTVDELRNACFETRNICNAAKNTGLTISWHLAHKALFACRNQNK